MDLLKKLLVKLVTNEVQIEGMRQKIAVTLKDKTKALFNHLDMTSRGYLLKQDVKRIVDLNALQISALS